MLNLPVHIKAKAIRPNKGEALASQENFCYLKKSVHHLINHITKTVLSKTD